MVDIKCNFPKGKFRKRESSEFSSDALNEDENLLRQPMRTSCTGFKEAKKAYENGTDEVRRILIQDCSLIYECNMCRNLFRSLANFISHKRSYCKNTTADNINSFSDRSSSVLIKTVEQSEPTWSAKNRSTASSPVPNTKSSNRDLSKVIERLKRVEVSPGCNKSKTIDEGYNKKVSSPEPKALDPVLELERVSTTSHAVYQTLKRENNTDSIKTELDEVNNLIENQKFLLRSDGKAIISPALMCFPSSAVNNSYIAPDENNYEATQLLSGISCEICKMSFQTEKTLKMHIQKNHTSSTYVFQCPTCSMTFLQPAAVIRHLANEHKKPLRRIRKMRDTILKKRIQIGDVQVKRPGREVNRLQMTNTKDLGGFNMINQQNGRSITSCTYCLKNFERRAALATHLASCLARKKYFNDAECSEKLSVANEQKNEDKPQNQIFNQDLEYSNRNDKIANGDTEVVKVNIKQEPPEDLNSITSSSSINKMFENLENQTFGNGLHTVCFDKIQMMVDLKEENSTEKEKTADAADNKDNKEDGHCSEEKIKESNVVVSRHKPGRKEKTKRFRVVAASKQLTCRCKICNKQFNALSNLRRHISMFHYRSRRFGCKLCDYRAFRRYDIVNHLTFVHKMTGERESMAVEYVTVHEIKYSKDDVDGDIVVVNDEATVSLQNNTDKEHKIAKEPQNLFPVLALNSHEKRENNKTALLQTHKDIAKPLKMDLIAPKDKSHGKVLRRKFKKSLEHQVESKKRPIRNRIKTVNKDFVYDLLTIKEEQKKSSHLPLKHRNANCNDQSNMKNTEFTPPPIKISPYRLRTEPLIPSDKYAIKGVAASVYRRVIHEGLAAPSTLPELPTERPQMRSRLISSSRTDSNLVPIIETSELEAAGLKSTFFDDSFLEKFAKKSNPSFKMKPLLALQHSPLNSILQKFDASQQSKINRTNNDIFQKPPEKDNSPPPDYAICLLQRLTQPNPKEKDFTPNGKQILDPSPPPAAPKKRITLMQRLAENRAKAKKSDNLICDALEN